MIEIQFDYTKKNLLSDNKFNGFPSETAGKNLILRALAAPAVFKTPAHIEVFLKREAWRTSGMW